MLPMPRQESTAEDSEPSSEATVLLPIDPIERQRAKYRISNKKRKSMKKSVFLDNPELSERITALALRDPQGLDALATFMHKRLGVKRERAKTDASLLEGLRASRRKVYRRSEIKLLLLQHLNNERLKAQFLFAVELSGDADIYAMVRALLAPTFEIGELVTLPDPTKGLGATGVTFGSVDNPTPFLPVYEKRAPSSTTQQEAAETLAAFSATLRM